jgi:oligopeptide transport system substrate-binding protein
MFLFDLHVKRSKDVSAFSMPERFSRTVLLALISFVFTACTQLEKPVADPFYAETKPPPKQEFRWSNGKMPKSFDPARASSPPETDIVRAVFDGLTDIDAKSLDVKPAVAEKWTSSEDLKTWTFILRADAKWSNGKPVTAEDFVRSWRRLAEMGDAVAHKALLNNITGFPLKKSEAPVILHEAPDFLLNSLQPQTPPLLAATPELPNSSNPAAPAPTTGENANTAESRVESIPSVESTLGVKAEDARTLKVTLSLPDKDFPKLVTNPIFRPVYGDGKDLETGKLNANIVTNGAFRISAAGPDGVALDRSENYWNQHAIKLEQVRFVPKDNAESALEAYRAGEIDAVTNAEFSPLVLKLLEPYEDFRRTTHGALNFYEINFEKAPFDDRRVRQALAISIERERLTDGELEGSTQPAFRFLPFGAKSAAKLTQDKDLARDLLEEAGFPGGAGFPVIKLLVNRNDTQQRIARSVARMWKQNLNLGTEIIVKETAEIETARASGDYDIVRRGVVLSTADEVTNFMTIFGSRRPGSKTVHEPGSDEKGALGNKSDLTAKEKENLRRSGDSSPEYDTFGLILSEEEALYELWAIPLYFPTSYSLVKPYVSGFAMNSLDAPSLNDVVIDNEWQPK